jgi:hypothetical protein
VGRMPSGSVPHHFFCPITQDVMQVSPSAEPTPRPRRRSLPALTLISTALHCTGPGEDDRQYDVRPAGDRALVRDIFDVAANRAAAQLESRRAERAPSRADHHILCAACTLRGRLWRVVAASRRRSGGGTLRIGGASRRRSRRWLLLSWFVGAHLRSFSRRFLASIESWLISFCDGGGGRPHAEGDTRRLLSRREGGCA